MKVFPTFKYEEKLWKKDYLVLGVDEVGRGSLAGPVYAGAVCFEAKKAKIFKMERYGINDSKKLSASQREKMTKVIKKISLAYSTDYSDVDTINKLEVISKP